MGQDCVEPDQIGLSPVHLRLDVNPVLTDFVFEIKEFANHDSLDLVRSYSFHFLSHLLLNAAVSRL